MTIERDKTQPATPSAKRDAADALREGVDTNARAHLGELQRSWITFQAHVYQKFDDGTDRMDVHDDKLDTSAAKLDLLTASVTAMTAQVSRMESLVRRGTNRITIAAVIGIWVCAGCLAAFMAFKLFGPIEPLRLRVGTAHAQEAAR